MDSLSLKEGLSAEEIFNSEEINALIGEISIELANRNLFPLVDFPQFVREKPVSSLAKDCTKLCSLVKATITEPTNLAQLINFKEKPQWLRYAFEFGEFEEKHDLERLSIFLSMGLLANKRLSIDDHVNNLLNRELFNDLDIELSDEYLVNLKDNRLKLLPHGIEFNGNGLIYLHQFLRRYFGSNFVGIPHLLNKAFNQGLEVSVRIDPLRKSSIENYRNLYELDHWYGPPFDRKILSNPSLPQRTTHISTGVQELTYDAKYTVFRTNMMDTGMRQFVIEEYCPINSVTGSEPSGLGKEFYVQKFAHMVYDQNKNYFVHLDASVRVFKRDEYEIYFKQIESGGDVLEKIGDRYKLFLIEGRIEEILAQEVLNEWFRYNSHIEEYFTGIKVEPLITYEKLELILNKNRST